MGKLHSNAGGLSGNSVDCKQCGQIEQRDGCSTTQTVLEATLDTWESQVQEIDLFSEATKTEIKELQG